MIELLDVSHWQPAIDWQKARSAGIKGVYIKTSQGTGYRDPAAAQHYAGAKAAGMKVGFYHFCTDENGIKQFDNFAQAANAIGKTDLPPVLDCEAYTSGKMIDLRFKLSYPSSDVVDVIGRRLLKYHPHAAIYTNKGSGDRIFGGQTIFGNRYQLWVAHWTEATTPLVPAAWKGKPFMCWQKAVVDGARYGVEGKVDYNLWGNALPFPGQEDPPPQPPPVDKLKVRITTNQGVYLGEAAKQ